MAYASRLYPWAKPQGFTLQMIKGGTIRLITDQIYLKPDFSTTGELEELPPNLDQVIDKIVHNKDELIQLHGGGCAIKFGLASDSPMKYTYFTNGQSREIKIGEQVVVFKHTTTKKYFLGSTQKINDAVALMFHLERSEVTQKVLDVIKAQLSEAEYQELISLDLSIWMMKKLSTHADKSDDSTIPLDLNNTKPEPINLSAGGLESKVNTMVSKEVDSNLLINNQQTKATESILKIANQIVNDEVDIVEIKLDLGNFKAQYYIRLNSKSLFSKVAKKLFS